MSGLFGFPTATASSYSVSKSSILPGLRIDWKEYRTVLENHGNYSEQKDSGLEILLPVDGFGIFVWGVSKTDELGAALHKKISLLLS